MKISTLILAGAIVVLSSIAHADRILGSGSVKWIGEVKRTTVENFPVDPKNEEQKKCEFFQKGVESTLVLLSLGKNVIKNDVIYLHESQDPESYGSHSWRYQKAQRTSCLQ